MGIAGRFTTSTHPPDIKFNGHVWLTGKAETKALYEAHIKLTFAKIWRHEWIEKGEDDFSIAGWSKKPIIPIRF